MHDFLTTLLRPFVLLDLLAVCTLLNLWRKRVETRRRLLLVTAPVVLLTILCLPPVAYLAAGSLEWWYPPRYDKPEDAQAIVVLSGYVLPPNAARRQSVLGRDTLQRCLYAAQLYHCGKPCLMVVVGGSFSPLVPDLPAARVMNDFLLEQKVAKSDLLMETTATNTYESAVNTRRLLADRGITRIVLVTDATHLCRAERCFRAQGFEVIPAGSRYEASEFNWSLRVFLPDPDSIQTIQKVLHEWIGLLLYRIRYRV